jgi:hypothetical protein
MVVFSTSYVSATKPGEDVNPNGFPSGPHYNLNIIGKKDTFTCPEQEYYLRVTTCIHDPVHDLVKECPDGDTCEQTEIPIYGNVVFVPQSGEDIQILMESGRKNGNGKKNEALPDTLQVIDPCTAAFDNDPAVVQIPKGDHWVYARALATPGDDVGMVITPGLVGAEDEYGNALIYMGILAEDGTFQTPYKSFERPKGKPNSAADITGLFQWTGTVCYLDPSDVPDGGVYYDHEVCAIDEDGDGYYDSYVEADWVTYIETGCPEGYDRITVYCHEYTDEWVFNIGDFVTYLWSLDNNGLKLLNVRLYPVDSAGAEQAPSRRNTLATKWGEIRSR